MDHLLKTLRQVEKLIAWAHTGRKPHSDSVEVGMVHEGLLYAYGEKGEDGVILRSGQTSERGLYRLVTGAMKELSEMGVPGVDLTSVATAVNTWRDSYFVKAMDSFDNLEELYEAMPYCFACFRSANGSVLHSAHIVSRGADTRLINIPENQILLCEPCHIQVQHRHGWDRLLDNHPHLYPRIEKARELIIG